MDCIEYMRSLPDNAFDIAVCDPPYGKGNDESLVGKGGEIRRNIQTLRQADGTDCWEDGECVTTSQRTHRFSGGTWAERYKTGGGVKPKHHNGMSLLRRSSLMNFFVSAAIR